MAITQQNKREHTIRLIGELVAATTYLVAMTDRSVALTAAGELAQLLPAHALVCEASERLEALVLIAEARKEKA